MGYIKEPDGVDLSIGPSKMTKKEAAAADSLMREIIRKSKAEAALLDGIPTAKKPALLKKRAPRIAPVAKKTKKNAAAKRKAAKKA